MKRILLLILIGLIPTVGNIYAKNHPLIPYPKEITTSGDSFVFDANNHIYIDSNIKTEVITDFIKKINNRYGIQLVVGKPKKATIKFLKDPNLKDEAYLLNISKQSIEVKSSSEAGLFYAIKSIEQLLSIEQTNLLNGKLILPTIKIYDEPRFGYRGVMIDVSRYFLPKKNLLSIIEVMGELKLNKLHLHLVDDNGWRIEIKKHPKLTDIGAWRVSRKELFPARENPKRDEPTPIGGYYTQEDIRDIVAFAAERMIEVIPEIEMPAHTISSLAAYPELACPNVTEFIGVLPGIGGPAAQFIYCAGNDNVFTFLEDVIDEVVDLFPSKYIHLGGDEAQKHYWKSCPLCKQRMKQENITEVEELQGYFMERMSKYVRSKGKEVLGWDEVTNSKLPKDIIVFGWQGEGNAALKAAKQGHKFVMTPAKKLYFIRYQGPQWYEPFTYFGNNTLKAAYLYEPIKENWDPKYKNLLMGIQGSLWTEFCNTPSDVEYLLFPRMYALAERAWSPATQTDWKSFINRLEENITTLEDKGMEYSKAIYNLDHKVTSVNGFVKVELFSDHPDATIKYSFNKLSPIHNGESYSQPISISKSEELTAQTFINNKPVGQPLTLNINWNKATARPINGAPTNGHLLTNGLKGSNRHSDFEWVGWYNSNGDFSVELDSIQSIHEVRLGSIINFGMGVHLPKKIEILSSKDGENYTSEGSKEFENEEIFSKTTEKKDIIWNNLSITAKYIKFKFTNPGVCPDNHTRAGMPVWVYFDELEIY